MTHAIEFRGVSKRFGGVHALSDVSFSVRGGTIHALVGENGAGKSTLMNVLGGLVTPDEGGVWLNGKKVETYHPASARQMGVRIVHQELSLFPDLSVTANVFGGAEISRRGWLDDRAMASRAVSALQRIQARVEPHATVGTLSVSEQQMVELARALSADANVIVLDEPNSALTESETLVLFQILRGMKARGVTILLVSHRLEEVFAIADEVTILRDGRHVVTRPAEETSISETITTMIGGALALDDAHKPLRPAPTEPWVEVSGLAVSGRVKNASFTAGRGEIVGLAGLEGAGVEDILTALFGLRRWVGGTLRLDGQSVRLRGPADAMQADIAYLPASRRVEGLFLNMSVEANLTSVALPRLARRGIVGRRALRAAARKVMTELHIRGDSMSEPVGNLSGGNQQKVVLAKWLLRRPRLLILNDPTRGIDVGAKQEIHTIIRRLADGGVTVLVTSSEYEEVAALADRVVVVHRGRVVGEIGGKDVTRTSITHAATTGTVATDSHSAPFTR